MHAIATAKIKFPHHAKHIMEKYANMARGYVRISSSDKRKRKEKNNMTNNVVRSQFVDSLFFLFLRPEVRDEEANKCIVS